MQHDHVGSDQLGDLTLQLQLLDRRRDHRFARGVEHHELIRMQAQPNVVGLRQLAGPLVRRGNCTGGVELLQAVAAERVSGERKDLAGHAEGADAQLVAALHRGGERERVVPGDLGQVASRGSATRGSRHSGELRSGT